ncbi:MAG TPA: cell division ATP-binding protein FtsE [Caulobacteraceae bacterium]|jgi:cell division transport system ATP-binding protein|nr:cell division ATP-binding protein FtsE [Caulobacteraceae bacterium]
MSRNAADHAASQEAEEDFGRSDAPVVRFENVGMRYGRAPEVLKDIGFKLTAGSFHFLTGPSGAGKSSLLKLMYLAGRPSRGSVHLFGENVEKLRRRDVPELRRRVGVVFQEYRLLDHLSAFDNVALPLRLCGRKPASYRDDVAELLSWVGLGQRMHALPRTLSGGEQQRLAIARAVVNRPELILADEPTGNVDHEMSLRIIRLFVELNRLGATVVIASHDEELVARSRMPVLYLDRGRLSRAASAGVEPDSESEPETEADYAADAEEGNLF